MAKINPEHNRTIALVGHVHAGKTSLVEAALLTAGLTTRLGKVSAGTTKTDYDPEEIKRKCSIRPVPVSFMHHDRLINIVDCPGFPDFVPEVKSILGAVDGAILLVNAQHGVEAQTEQFWDDLVERNLPTVVAINRMDQENSNFSKTLGELTETLKGRRFAPFVIPFGPAEQFTGVIDIVHSKAFSFDGTTGKFTESSIPEDRKELCAAFHEQLMESAADATDELTEKYLEQGELNDEDIESGLRIGVLNGRIVPVVGTSAETIVGVPRLLDIIAAYFPSPTDRVWTANKPGSSDEIEVKGSDGPFSAFVFKMLVEQHVGELDLIRVVSGSVKAGETVLNSTTGEKEKIGQIFRLVGRDRIEIPEIGTGEIGALVKLRGTHLGHTLCHESRPVVFPPSSPSEPTMTQAIKPSSQADQEKLSVALHKVLNEDPGVRCDLDPVTHEFVLAAHGDLQMEVFFRRLLDKQGVHVDRAKPVVPYRETLRGQAEAEGKVKKQSGGRGQFAVVNLRVEPNPGEGFEFVDAIVGGVVPRNYIPAVEKGLRESLPRGIMAGYPVTDVKVTLFFGKYHDVDSSEMAFKTAASVGFKEAARNARPILLEPVMNVSILAPDAYTGDLIGDLNSRRGKIQGMDPVAGKTRIRAHVPLAEVHNYLATLRAITAGRCDYGLELSHYEEAPASVADAVIKEAQARKEAAHD